MAIALVGTIGAVSTGAASAAVTPAWGASENRTANNLLVLQVAVTGSATIPTTPSGWSIGKTQAGTSCSASIFYKLAAGADAAPTVAAITSGVINARLAEFSGPHLATPISSSGGVAGTTSPLVATNAATDGFVGSMMVSVASLVNSATRANAAWNQTYNNGSDIEVTNAATSTTVSHYGFAYSATTANASADSDSFAFTTTQLTGAALALVTFDPVPILAGIEAMSATAGMTVGASATTTSGVVQHAASSLLVAPGTVTEISAVTESATAGLTLSATAGPPPAYTILQSTAITNFGFSPYAIQALPNPLSSGSKIIGIGILYDRGTDGWASVPTWSSGFDTFSAAANPTVMVADSAFRSSTGVAPVQTVPGARFTVWVGDIVSSLVGTSPQWILGNSGTPGITMVLLEVAGLPTGNTTQVDGTAGVTWGNAGTTPGLASYASTTTGEMLLNLYGSAEGGETWTVPSGYTDVIDVPGTNNAQGNGNVGVALKQSTGGTETGTFTTTSNAAQWFSIVLALGTTPAIPKFSTLVDDFSSGTLDAKWTIASGTVTVTGGQVVVPISGAGSTFSQLESTAQYDLTESAVFVQLVNGGNQTTVNLDVTPLYLTSNWVDAGWDLNHGVLKTQMFSGTDWSATYDPAVHKWFRIRETGGHTYWDYSTDAVSWTNVSNRLSSVANDNLYYFDLLGTQSSGGSATSVVWDNVNTVPAFSTVTGTVALSSTAGMTVAASAPVAASVTMAGVTSLTAPGVVTKNSSLILTEGFETIPAWAAGTLVTGRGGTSPGTHAMSLTAQAATYPIPGAQQSPGMRVGVWFASSSSNNPDTILQLCAPAGNPAVTVQTTAFRTVTAKVFGAGGLQINSSTATVANGTWHYLECYLSTSNTVGVIQVSLDGTLFATFSGDTEPGTSFMVETLVLANAGNAATLSFDDLFLTEDLGPALSATAGLTVAGSVSTTQAGSVALSATAGMTVAATRTQLATVSLAGTASLTPTALVTQVAQVIELAAAGELVVGTVIRPGAVSLAGTAGMTIAASAPVAAAVSLSASAALTPTAVRTQLAVVTLAGTAGLTVTATTSGLGPSFNAVALAGMTLSGAVQEAASVLLTAVSALVGQPLPATIQGQVALAPHATMVLSGGVLGTISVAMAATAALTGQPMPQTINGIVAMASSASLAVPGTPLRVAVVQMSAVASLLMDATVRVAGSNVFTAVATMQVIATTSPGVRVNLAASTSMMVRATVVPVGPAPPPSLADQIAAVVDEDPVLLGATGYLDDVFTARLSGDSQ